MEIPYNNNVLYPNNLELLNITEGDEILTFFVNIYNNNEDILRQRIKSIFDDLTDYTFNKFYDRIIDVKDIEDISARCFRAVGFRAEESTNISKLYNELNLNFSEYNNSPVENNGGTFLFVINFNKKTVSYLIASQTTINPANIIPENKLVIKI